VASEELEEGWVQKCSEAVMSASTIGTLILCGKFFGRMITLSFVTTTAEVLKIAADEFDALSEEEFSDGDEDEDEEYGDDLDAAFESVDA